MVEHAWRLTSVSVLLDSQEATVRKVTLALLGEWGGEKEFQREGKLFF